ncbi:energy transducer TonB [Azomonas macrocytogenes]|uniref:Energy transducer TonB n=1 Tax=Azomonas macrocytogenes TaxID=69962 RepID=A0A839T5R8_AZOMA|nr:energy transducer TonB [Azomonas macrocytogenes]MBB3104150.1 hypothetical protein [Azomonas macrocytogenes]
MMSDARRRAYLNAMQVDSWVSRLQLPFAAPLRPGAIAEPEPLPESKSQIVVAKSLVTEMVRKEAPGPLARKPASPVPVPVKRIDQKSVEPTPHFTLQLLRAGSCLLAVTLPTGGSFQNRDPAYLLLKDLLRAARLPDKPQLIGDGEPIRWPLWQGGDFGQGAEDARDYVQGVILSERDNMGYSCLWLVGRPAWRFAGGVSIEVGNSIEIQTDLLGMALAIPGLEELMEKPVLKAELWRALCRNIPIWTGEA